MKVYTGICCLIILSFIPSEIIITKSNERGAALFCDKCRSKSNITKISEHHAS